MFKVFFGDICKVFDEMLVVISRIVEVIFAITSKFLDEKIR